MRAGVVHASPGREARERAHSMASGKPRAPSPHLPPGKARIRVLLPHVATTPVHCGRRTLAERARRAIFHAARYVNDALGRFSDLRDRPFGAQYRSRRCGARVGHCGRALDYRAALASVFARAPKKGAPRGN